jgi:hypothetical protein
VNPTEILLQVATLLEALGVPYAVVGSMASSAWGFPRTTNDADLVAELQPFHIDVLVAALSADFYIDRAAVEQAVTRGRSFNAIHLESAFKVDVFVPQADGFGRQQIARRRREPLGPGPAAGVICVATAEDVVLANLDWYRAAGSSSDRQWQDVTGILKVQGPALDLAYLRLWAARLSLTSFLDRALSEVGAGD